MDGVMIFGLATAFLFNAMREFRPVRQARVAGLRNKL